MEHEKFIYVKQQRIDSTGIFYAWYLIDGKSREGVHFHGYTMSIDKFSMSNAFGFVAAGIECHKTKPHYEGHEPVKGHCIVTLGDCYCDGSSLQASERLGHINPTGTDDNQIWGVLHEYYGYWIAKEPEELEKS